MKLTRFKITFDTTEIVIYEYKIKNLFLSVLNENMIDYKITEEEYEC